MKIKDLKGKKIIYKCDMGDSYYFDEKLIVEVDANNYCLLNYENSFSGYIEYTIESVDKEFISSFFHDHKFLVENELIDEYLNEDEDVVNSEIILIPKEIIESYILKK